MFQFFTAVWLFVVDWSAKFERLFFFFFYHFFLDLFAGSVYTGVDFCKRLCGVSVIRRYKSIPIRAFGFPLKKRLFYYYCSLLGFLYKWTNGLWDAFLVYKTNDHYKYLEVVINLDWNATFYVLMNQCGCASILHRCCVPFEFDYILFFKWTTVWFGFMGCLPSTWYQWWEYGECFASML
jgi:hypothetical protein